MQWTKNLPSEPGMYLRNTKGSKRLVFYLLNGKLLTKIGNRYLGTDHWQIDQDFWWLGPLPDVPLS